MFKSENLKYFDANSTKFLRIADLLFVKYFDSKLANYSAGPIYDGASATNTNAAQDMPSYNMASAGTSGGLAVYDEAAKVQPNSKKPKRVPKNKFTGNSVGLPRGGSMY